MAVAEMEMEKTEEEVAEREEEGEVEEREEEMELIESKIPLQISFNMHIFLRKVLAPSFFFS